MWLKISMLDKVWNQSENFKIPGDKLLKISKLHNENYKHVLIMGLKWVKLV